MTGDQTRRGFWDRVQSCDPRILYVVFAVMMIVLQFKTVSIPAPVPRAAKGLYDLIEKLPTDKIVIIDSSADVGWLAEARPTMEAIVRHLLQRRIPFAICANTTYNQGQGIGTEITDRIVKEMAASGEKREYGVDYCYWQAINLVAGGGVMVQALAKDIPGTVIKDLRGTAIQSLPMMKNVRDIHDVSLIYRVCYDWEGIPWIGFVQAVYGTPFAVGVASISSSSAYPFLDSGQMCGVLAGAAGAAGYERLLNYKGSGTRIVARQSFATLYVVLAVVLGNLAMLAVRIEKRRKVRTQ